MDYKKIEEKYIAPTYGRRGITIVKGEGCYLYDTEGKKYIDCFSNVGVNILGHNSFELNQAIESQLKKLTNLHCSFYNDSRAIFAKKLIEKCPESLKKVFFCNSGTESVEAAIKFSRLATGRKEILAAKQGYHGKTFGSLSLTKTKPKYRKKFLPLLEDVKHFSFNDADSLREIISEKTAAVILEPIQGEGGIRLADNEFMKEVREICDEFNALLIVDEVQSGMGRTGKMFAIQHYKINPDMMCLAKGLAGGVPVGATIISEEISKKLFKGCHTNTFGGNPLVCAAGVATLDIIEENDLVLNAEEVGNYFMEELRNLDSSIIREVRGKGLMIGVELKRRAVRYLKALQDKGILAFPSGSIVIRFLPPLIMSKDQVDEVIEIISKVLK